jgi:carbamoyl-phosphate synthase large subunit
MPHSTRRRTAPRTAGRTRTVRNSARIAGSRKTAKPASRRRPRLAILFTCVGRRIELLKGFQRAARSLKIDLFIHGADINRTAPAMHFVDRAHIVPRIEQPRHIPALIELVKQERIDAIIPLIDSDLEALSRSQARFSRAGARVVISDPDVIRACSDKLLTFKTLARAGVDTPQTWSSAEALRLRRHAFPYFFKPRRGSAGQGLFRIDSLAELRVFAARDPDSVVQEYVEGVEYTLDVYTGLDGEPRCVVPRRRLEVRTGEVSKGLIVKEPRVMAVGRRAVAALGRCRGVITVQCMAAADGRICVIEINPRFGGGAPLAIAAGADFPKWLMAELLDLPLRIDYQAYRDNLAMLRYDESVFVDGNLAAGEQAARLATRRMT